MATVVKLTINYCKIEQVTYIVMINTLLRMWMMQLKVRCKHHKRKLCSKILHEKRKLIGTKVILLITCFNRMSIKSNQFVKYAMKAVVICTCAHSASDECMRFVEAHTLLKQTAHYRTHVMLKMPLIKNMKNKSCIQNQVTTIV